jgi:DNA-binding transcriptional LysR family regulator
VSTVQGGRPQTFSLVVVPGVTVDKWTRAWLERLPQVPLQVTPVDVGDAAALIATTADAGLVRLPIDRDRFHAISLYTETTVVVVPLDHLLAAAGEVTVNDLGDETMLRPSDDVLAWTEGSRAGGPAVPVDTTAAGFELVAAGVGVLVVPQSLARAYHRRDLTYRVVTDAPTSSVALAWKREEPAELIEEMIGIVRGRTVNSTRGSAPPPAQPPARKGARRDSRDRRPGQR